MRRHGRIGRRAIMQAMRIGQAAQGEHEQLQQAVIQWYDSQARDLPWRSPGTTPWGILVSEVMAQQTPVARVAPQWQSWLQRWPTPADLAAAAPAEVLRAWGRLGYPRRALRLQAAAQVIVDQHEGQVPDELTALRALPGIGDYTAAAVAVFAFEQRAAVVDVNVRRVLARCVGATAEPAPSLTAFERGLAERLLPNSRPTAARWSVAVMELGALVCTARSPRCQECPVVRQCAWQLAGRPPHTGPARRSQGYEGTDRQARGRVLARLREHPEPADDVELGRWCRDEGQRRRALDSLLADGLIETDARGRYGLPGTLPATLP